MKKSNRTAAFLLMLIGVLFIQVWVAAAQGVSDGPKAVAPEPTKDLGSVTKGVIVTHDFIIRNEGKAVLEITQVKAACGCVAVTFDRTVGPGQVGKVHVALDTTAFTGPVAKGATVYTNDASNLWIELTLRAKIVPIFDVKPGYARFIAVQGEVRESVIEQHIAATDGSSFQILKADGGLSDIKVTFHEAASNERLPEFTGKQWIVRIELLRDMAVGPLAVYVSLTTDSQRQPLIQIPVSGFVRPVVAVTPPSADLGDIQITEPLRRTFDFRAFSTDPISVTSVESTVKNIEVKFEPLTAGREYVVRITIDPAIAKGPFNGKLVIRTDSKKAPLIEVALKGVVL